MKSGKITQNISALNGIYNFSFSASLSSGSITISAKGADGNDPSVTNISGFKMRSSTLTDSKMYERFLTSAQSIVIPAAATFGFGSTEVGRIYLWVIDNSGVLELALSRTSDLYPEETLVTTVQIGSGSTSASTMYSTTARASVPCKLVGYFEVQRSSPNWLAPIKLQVMNPNVKKTGELVRIPVRKEITAYSTNSTYTSIPFDGTPPQQTEGWNAMSSDAYTPLSVTNKLKVRSNLVAGINTSSSFFCISVYRDSTANPIITTGITIATSGIYTLLFETNYFLAASIASTIFNINIGETGGHAVSLNGYNGTAYFSTTCWIEIMEVAP